jgi:hypothetical protein
VALKILPEAFASDPDWLARFRREAMGVKTPRSSLFRVTRMTRLWRPLDALPDSLQRTEALATYFAIADDPALPPLRLGVELVRVQASA